MKAIKTVIFILSIFPLFASSCKKIKDAHIPPDVVFKTDAGYTSADKTISMGDSILVGIIATKTEDDLKSYNISYAYDGVNTTTTFFNYILTSVEFLSYTHDNWIKTRNQAGTEKWYFTVLDRDGNITQKTITLTVQ